MSRAHPAVDTTTAPDEENDPSDAGGRLVAWVGLGLVVGLNGVRTECFKAEPFVFITLHEAEAIGDADLDILEGVQVALLQCLFSGLYRTLLGVVRLVYCLLYCFAVPRTCIYLCTVML